jgi:phage-related protein
MSSTATRDAHQIASSFDVIRHAAASFGADVAHVFDNVRHGLADSGHFWASTFDRMRHDIASWAADVGHFIGQVVSFFAGLPGRILSALGNLGSLLLHAGESIMDGLLHGIMAGWNKVASFVSGIAGTIASLKGPLDYDLVLLVPHGRAIMQGLMNGIGSRMPDLAAQLGGVSRMIGGMPGGGPGGRGGGPLQLQVMPGGGSAFEQFMVLAMRNYVRVRGGDVQSVLGHG